MSDVMKDDPFVWRAEPPDRPGYYWNQMRWPGICDDVVGPRLDLVENVELTARLLPANGAVAEWIGPILEPIIPAQA